MGNRQRMRRAGRAAEARPTHRAAVEVRLGGTGTIWGAVRFSFDFAPRPGLDLVGSAWSRLWKLYPEANRLTHRFTVEEIRR